MFEYGPPLTHDRRPCTRDRARPLLDDGERGLNRAAQAVYYVRLLGVVAAEPVNAALECVSAARDSRDAYFVRKFAQIFRDYKAGARLVLPDREFYSANVVNALSASGNGYLTAVKNDGIKKATIVPPRPEECRLHVLHEGQRVPMREVRADHKAGRRARWRRQGEEGARDHRQLQSLPPTCRWGRHSSGYWCCRRSTAGGGASGPTTGSRRRSGRGRRVAASRFAVLFFASLFMHNVWAVEHARRGTDPGEATLKDGIRGRPGGCL